MGGGNRRGPNGGRGGLGPRGERAAIHRADGQEKITSASERREREREREGESGQRRQRGRVDGWMMAAVAGRKQSSKSTGGKTKMKSRGDEDGPRPKTHQSSQSPGLSLAHPDSGLVRQGVERILVLCPSPGEAREAHGDCRKGGRGAMVMMSMIRRGNSGYQQGKPRQ